MNEKDIRKLVVKSKRYSVNCGEGLYLRVSPTGTKSWVLRHYHAHKVRDITLGRWPELTLLQARQSAHFKRKELEIKPSRGLTFADGYHLWKRKKKGHIVSYHDECARIERHLLPHLKRLQLEDVTAPVVLNVLLKIEDKLPTLQRCLMRVNEILELCVCAGLLNSNPCRKLSKIFASHQAVNRAFIPASDLHILFSLLKDESEWFKCYVLFAVYSMLRPNECCSVRWSWIHDDTLILPSEIMKKRRAHRVPLCPEILQLLQYVKSLRTGRLNKYVWAFGRNRQHINKQHLTKWLSKTALAGKLCHHSLRATARTWMRDNNVIYEVAEDALAHLSGTTTERAYLRGDYLEQRRSVMQAWWNFIYKQYCAVCAPIDGIKLDKSTS